MLRRKVGWRGRAVVVILVAGFMILLSTAALSGPQPAGGTARWKTLPLSGDEQPQKPPAEAATGDQTAVVQKGSFSVSVKFQGTFEAAEAAPVALSPEAWKPDAGGMPLVVRRVLPHGSRVSKGQPILWVETERLVETIRDLEASRELSRLSVQILEREIPILRDSLPLDLAAADRARKEAQEDLDRHVKEDRAFAERMADEEVKMSRFLVEFAEEEMRQLEKMYKADDLVEDTEKIIMRRQQMYIDFYKFLLAQDEKKRRDLLQYELPRKDVALRERLQKLSLEDAKARATLALQADRKQVELEKARIDADKNEERLAKLRRDRQLLENIVAPMDGLVYYGRFEDGQWQGFDEVKSQLVPGGIVQPHKILLTILSPKVNQVTATVEEKELEHLKPGAKVRLSPTSRPDAKLTGTIQAISPHPVAPGKFSVRIALSESPDTLVPGMTATVTVVAYTREVALTVPAEAVKEDELQEGKHYVLLLAQDGKPVRVYVKVGKSDGKRIEILEGLKEGQKVLLQPSEKNRESKP